MITSESVREAGTYVWCGVLKPCNPEKGIIAKREKEAWYEEMEEAEKEDALLGLLSRDTPHPHTLFSTPSRLASCLHIARDCELRPATDVLHTIPGFHDSHTYRAGRVVEFSF